MLSLNGLFYDRVDRLELFSKVTGSVINHENCLIEGMFRGNLGN